MDSKNILFFIILITSGNSTPRPHPQSNDGIQGNDIEYNPDEYNKLPGSVTLAGNLTHFDDLKPQIALNRTSGVLNCEDGTMKLDLTFKEKFYGIAYSDFDRNSACFVQGTGNSRETLELPLKGCGTKQDPLRVFTNNVVIRFHPNLEMEGDEVITIVCRYPPPIVPLPPLPILAEIPAPLPVAEALQELPILMIICAVLFLGLTLLGLGCSAFCVKQRNIQVVRKRPFTPLEDEVSEKLSSTDSFTSLKIPRVHPPSTGSSSAVLEEILASDSQSSLENVPHRPGTISSEYSDTHIRDELETIPPALKIREPLRSLQNTELLDSLSVVDREDVATEIKYTQPMALRKPDISYHTVDDVYLQTIVERKLIEDVERRTREETQFYQKEQPKWDVTITSHATHDDDAWERGSGITDVASSIGWSTVDEPAIRPHYTTLDRDLLTRRNVTETETVLKMESLRRVLEADMTIRNRTFEASGVTETETDYESETASVLTEDDREKWRQIISRESTLRSLLTQATVREDYERIRRDTRYEKLFEPEKWDVIIRVLAPPVVDNDRFFSDSASQVSSTVSATPPHPQKPRRALRIRKESLDELTAGLTTTTDYRTMSQVMTNFSTNDYGRDNDSVTDRSQSEIVEFAPLEDEDSDTTIDDDNTLRRGMGLTSTRIVRQQDVRINDIVSSDVNTQQQTQNVSRQMQMAESGEFVQESSSRTTYSSSRLTRQ